MNKTIWDCFLGLQGLLDSGEEIPPENVYMPLDQYIKKMESEGVFKFFKQNGSVLVVGAGPGGEVVALNNNGFNAMGITLLHKDVGAAEKYYRIKLIMEDMHRMVSFVSSSFDSVYSSHTLEHSLSPLIAVFEIRRVLKTMGRACIVVPRDTPEKVNGLQHYSVLSEAAWKHLFDICGFDIAECSTTKESFIFKLVKINRDCPARFFEQRLIAEGMWK